MSKIEFEEFLHIKEKELLFVDCHRGYSKKVVVAQAKFSPPLTSKKKSGS